MKLWYDSYVRVSTLKCAWQKSLTFASLRSNTGYICYGVFFILIEHLKVCFILKSSAKNPLIMINQAYKTSQSWKTVPSDELYLYFLSIMLLFLCIAVILLFIPLYCIRINKNHRFCFFNFDINLKTVCKKTLNSPLKGQINPLPYLLIN